MIILQMTQLWPPAAIPHVSLLAGCARSLCCAQCRTWGCLPIHSAGAACARLPVARQEPQQPPTALQHRHFLLIDSDSRHHEEC